MTALPLRFLAGPTALARIRDHGLTPDAAGLVAGAAGGPKWLILKALDQALVGTFFKDRRRPLPLIGASSGAWRFAAWSQPDPETVLDRLCDAYTTQTYAARPGPADVTAQARRIMAAYLPPNAGTRALAHPWVRLGLITARTRHFLASRRRRVQALGLIVAAAVNAVHRRLLGLFLERVLVVDPRLQLPLTAPDGLPSRTVSITPDNFRIAILASGSIPLVMSPVPIIPDAPAGPYLDGGAVDYHPALPYHLPADTIALMPHYTDRLIPGWLDKGLAWRRPSATHTDRLLVVAPTRRFVDRLPGARIPDRTDFKTFVGKDEERIRRWRTATAAGGQLADAFMEAAASGKIREWVEPLS